MAKLDLRRPDRPVQVGVILMNGMTEILDVAPVDILHSLSKRFLQRLTYLPDAVRSQGVDIDFHWVTEDGADAALTGGATIKATDSFETCPPLDIVIIGAHWSGNGPASDHTPGELDFVRKSYEHSTAFISICAGMMTPLAAGILNGKTCTGPRSVLERMRKEHPAVNWVEKRYVKDADGKTWTSGTLLNGLDLMRAFVEETWGGPGSLAETVLRDGAWPVRDVDYKDLDATGQPKFYQSPAS